MDKVFKALADQSRRHLLDVLCEDNGRTLTELCDHLSSVRQTTTKHLKVLEGAGLITVKWHGREKLHYLNPMPLQETYGRWIKKFERNRLKVLDDLKINLEESRSKKPKEERTAL